MGGSYGQDGASERMAGCRGPHQAFRAVARLGSAEEWLFQMLLRRLPRLRAPTRDWKMKGCFKGFQVVIDQVAAHSSKIAPSSPGLPWPF